MVILKEELLELVRQMELLAATGADDPTSAHRLADDLLVDALRLLADTSLTLPANIGLVYTLTDTWRSVPRWYE